jgi:hypothetical protein
MNNMNIDEKTQINYKKYHMWSHKIGKRDDVVETCLLRENKTNKILNYITEEEKGGDKKNIFKDDDLKKKEDNRRGKLSILPERVHNNINETRRLNLDLKRQVDEITKMNAVYVMKQSGINKDNTDLQLPPIEGNKKNNEITNFRYISETYRKQLMRAFLNFNPIIHLNNLRNLLEKADPEIKK